MKVSLSRKYKQMFARLSKKIIGYWLKTTLRMVEVVDKVIWAGTGTIQAVEKNQAG